MAKANVETIDNVALVKDYLKPMLMAINSDIKNVVYIENPDGEYIMVICEFTDISVKITGDSPLEALKNVSTKLISKL